MRNSYWLVVSLLVLECVVLLIQPSECFLSFIPVSVHTALQILTLLVKIKSIIFKILLGLKLMGAESIIMKRRKRSTVSIMNAGGGGEEVSEDTSSKSYLDWKLGSLPEYQRTELLYAWERLEKLLGEKVRFQEDVCMEAMHKYGQRPVALWAEGEYLGKGNNNDNVEASSSNYNYNNVGGKHESNHEFKWNYSYWISTVLGSALGSPYACHILEKQLNFNEQLANIVSPTVNVPSPPPVERDSNVSQPTSFSGSKDNFIISSSVQTSAFS